MNPLISIAIQSIPEIIALIRSAFTKANPDAPVPPDAEIHAAYLAAISDTLAKDAAILAATDPNK